MVVRVAFRPHWNSEPFRWVILPQFRHTQPDCTTSRSGCACKNTEKTSDCTTYTTWEAFSLKVPGAHPVLLSLLLFYYYYKIGCVGCVSGLFCCVEWLHNLLHNLEFSGCASQGCAAARLNFRPFLARAELGRLPRRGCVEVCAGQRASAVRRRELQHGALVDADAADRDGVGEGEGRWNGGGVGGSRTPVARRQNDATPAFARVGEWLAVGVNPSRNKSGNRLRPIRSRA